MRTDCRLGQTNFVGDEADANTVINEIAVSLFRKVTPRVEKPKQDLQPDRAGERRHGTGIRLYIYIDIHLYRNSSIWNRETKMQTKPLELQAEAFSSGARRGARYLQQLHGSPVHPETARLGLLDPGLSDEGMEVEAVLDLMETVGGEGTVSSAGGRYFGYVVGGALPAASAARALLSAWDQVADSLTGPSVIKMEEVAISWVVDLLGLPAGTTGAFTSGATMANMTLLVTARDALLARQGHSRGAGLFGAPRLRIVASAEIHATVLKSVRMAGLSTDDIEWVEVDNQGRLQLEALPDLDAKTIVLAQAGNVCTGASDPIGELAAKCQEAGSWLHVDGAFGLWARTAETLRAPLAGLEGADSWVVDSHKTLNTPYDAGLALCRHPEEMQASMAIGAQYLPATTPNPANRAPEFSRSARGAETWAALLSLGRRGVSDLATGFHLHAKRIARELTEMGFEIPHDVHFNQVFVTLPGSEDGCARIVENVQNSGEAWFGPATWQGKKGFRISVSNWTTSDEDVDRLIAAIGKAKDELV
jgi:glutamate/tyrosine decarboxylase-like PLP-dependent enzyme